MKKKQLKIEKDSTENRTPIDYQSVVITIT